MLVSADVIGAPLHTPERPGGSARHGEGRTLPAADRMWRAPAAAAVRMQRHKFSVRRSPEQAGAHTSEVLLELGYKDET